MTRARHIKDWPPVATSAWSATTRGGATHMYASISWSRSAAETTAGEVTAGAAPSGLGARGPRFLFFLPPSPLAAGAPCSALGCAGFLGCFCRCPCCGWPLACCCFWPRCCAGCCFFRCPPCACCWLLPPPCFCLCCCWGCLRCETMRAVTAAHNA